MLENLDDSSEEIEKRRFARLSKRFSGDHLQINRRIHAAVEDSLQVKCAHLSIGYMFENLDDSSEEIEKRRFARLSKRPSCE